MKYIVAVLVIIALTVAGFFAYSFIQSSQPESMETVDQMMEKDTMMDQSTDSMMMDDKMSSSSGDSMMDNQMSHGEYLEYSKAALQSAAIGKRVLFFYASWCPTCRPTDADLKANISQIPEGVSVIRVNYNDPETDAEEKALAQKYGVTYQHTYVQIDQNGNQVTKWNGGKTAELLANIK
jgi:thiol-disulfide isomerase/thioredoxin